MKSNKTREKILDSSLKLFNEKKASNVSTVQISTAMKISPGNLYYYFANKEELIRCIWEERMMVEVKDIFEAHRNITDIGDAFDIFREYVKHCIKYRFFYTELPTLFTNDAKLASECREILKSNWEITAQMISSLMAAGLVREMNDEDRRLLAENCRIISRSAVINYDISENRDVDESTYRAMMLLAKLFEPYATGRMKEEVKRELTSRRP